MAAMVTCSYGVQILFLPDMSSDSLLLYWFPQASSLLSILCFTGSLQRSPPSEGPPVSTPLLSLRLSPAPWPFPNAFLLVLSQLMLRPANVTFSHSLMANSLTITYETSSHYFPLMEAYNFRVGIPLMVSVNNHHQDPAQWLPFLPVST